MPIGPNGEKRPADAIAQAVMIGRIATGEAEEEYVDTAKRRAGRKGAKARAQSMSAEQRSEAGNFANQTIWTGDNLPIMRGLNDASVDLIYLDPPFNSKTNYAAPIESKAAGAEFKDTWTLSDVDLAWIDLIEAKHPALYRVLLAAMTDSDKSYLAYMAVRLLEMQRLLKPTGSIWLHCDPTMSHYLKLVMDAVFGRHTLRNEIIWCYTGPGSPKMRQFNRKHDVLLWYVAGDRWTFNADAVRVPHTRLNTNRNGAAIGEPLTDDLRNAYLAKGKVPETWWSRFSPVGRLKNERVGYPTQKPLALLRRIIEASSNVGDTILDPFCGCATTLVAADQLTRKWAGIDIAPKAAQLVVERIRRDQGMFRNVIHRDDIPQRTDMGDLIRYNDPRNKRHLYGEQDGCCNGCGEHFRPQNLEVDHIVAQAQGGTDHLSNLQLLCGHCNRVKGDRGMEHLKAKLQIAARGHLRALRQGACGARVHRARARPRVRRA